MARRRALAYTRGHALLRMHTCMHATPHVCKYVRVDMLVQICECGRVCVDMFIHQAERE